MFSVAFFISWHRPRKVKEMLEGADQALSEGSKKPEILPFGMSRQQVGRIPLKRAGLCEHETVRYGELDRQSYIPLLDGLSTFRPLSS